MVNHPRSIRSVLVVALAALLGVGTLAPTSALAQDASTAASDPTATTEETVPVAPADTGAPTIAQPGDVVVAAVDASGAVVAYVVPGAVDDVDGAVAVACAPAPGSLFPLGTTFVTCSAGDAAGNLAAVSFAVTVLDQQPPVIAQPGAVVVDALDAGGAVVDYAVPGATDNVDGFVAVGCDPAPGSVFPVGTTTVTCFAQDTAGNPASVAFPVTVNAPPPATVEAPTTVEAPATATPTAPPSPEATATAPAVTTAEATEQASVTPTAVPTEPPTPEPTPTAPALELPWPPPPPLVLITGSGPLGDLSLIWGGLDFPVSQEYGHTEFSLSQMTMYLYGLAYGLDGRAHPGIDVGMPAGTWLYSPVVGTVKIAGGTPYYTHYGNGQPGVGQLLIETDDGHEVVLGHMGRIAVQVGDRLTPGQFVGVSGGENGDHLHLETRERQPGGGFRVVDPRESFLVAVAAPTGFTSTGFTCEVVTADVDAPCFNDRPVTKASEAQRVELSQDAPTRTCRHIFKAAGEDTTFEVLVSPGDGPVEIGDEMEVGVAYSHRARCGPTYTGPVTGTIAQNG